MDLETIPEKYRNTIWDMLLVTPMTPVYVLAQPDSQSTTNMADGECDKTRSGVFISYTPTTIETMRPVIFTSAIGAELYRQFMMDCGLGPVDEFEIRLLDRLPTPDGYMPQPVCGVCPTCGELAMYGNMETNEFFCEKCKKPFKAIPETQQTEPR